MLSKMEASLFVCPICSQDYDLEDRIPKMIIPCGHTICFDCLSKITANSNINIHKCPFDDNALTQDINSYPKNYSLACIIEQRSKMEKCEIHKQKLVTYVCLTEQKKICDLCFRDHQKKKHDLESIEALETQSVESVQKIDTFLENLKKHHNKFNLKLQENHKRQIVTIKDEINKIRALIDQKEQEMILESSNSLETKEKILENTFGENSNLFTIFSKRKAELKNITSNRILYRENLDEELATQIEYFEFKMDHSLHKMDLEANEFNKSLIIIREDVERSILNTRTSLLFNDEFAKFLQAFCNEETSLENQSRDLWNLKIKSNLIFDYHEGVLTIQNTSRNLNVNLEDFKKWNDIHAVNLNLTKRISKEDFKLIDFIWKRLINLSSLKINIIGKTTTQGSIDNTEVSDILEDFDKITFSSSPFLQEIVLYALQTTTTDFWIENFLSNLQNLKKLDLDLRKTQITDKTVLLLSQTLSKSPMIEKFEVWLSNTKISDKYFEGLFRALPNIKIFDISLAYTEISDKTLEIFVKNALPSMENLESLSLFLSGTKITDRQVVELLENIPNIKILKIFLSDTEVTDKSIQPFLTNKLLSLTKLTRLVFKLERTGVSKETKQHAATIINKINRTWDVSLL